MVFENPVIKELLQKYRRLWSISHAMSLMIWDLETYLPKEGVEERSIAYSELSLLSQELLLNKEFLNLLERGAVQEGLNDFEKGVVRVLQREVRVAKALPPSLVQELAQVSQEAPVAWREAKRKNKFSLFKPYLEKIVELTKRKAEYLGYDEHPYDALVDLYEEGLRTRDVENMFNRLEPALRKILDKVLSEGYFPKTHPLEEKNYDEKELDAAIRNVLSVMGFPFDKASRMDVSAHPFTINMGIKDVRITTRYEGKDFKRALLGAVHEFGHALYELQIDESLKTTPLARGVSLGIHESQSRFWENIVGRSMAFINAFYGVLRKFSGEVPKEYIYKYFNTVKPSLIRVEADEVTYNLHILLRFRLEKMLVTGELNVDDLPEFWDNEMERLLGVRPKNYSTGVLQDIHWSQASIGYFPTYSIGNLVSAQIWHHITSDLPDFYDLIAKAKFDPIKRYLRNKIHMWGATYPPKELLIKAFGEEINPDYFIRYLEEKYLSKKGF